MRSVQTAYRLNYHVLGQQIHEIGSMKFLLAGRVLYTWPAGPKIALHFPCLLVYVCIYIFICASALITCAIITYIVPMQP